MLCGIGTGRNLPVLMLFIVPMSYDTFFIYVNFRYHSKYFFGIGTVVIR